MCHLERHRAAPQYHGGGRNLGKFEQIVAGQAELDAGDGWTVDHRSRRDATALERDDFLTTAHQGNPETMGIKELRMTTNELKAPAFQLFPPVIGELGDQAIFTRQDRLGIEADRLGTKTELGSMS